ncbi:hypothetical protein, partial [Klebsiella pneumoniae]|uniref:hypothetical protein n=1 Tax=Klebsiella pneumoniae TaxID=573 RepID=UPI001C6A61FD
GGKNSLNRLIRCVCGKKIGPDPRNFNQRVSLGRNDLLIRTFPYQSNGLVFYNLNVSNMGIIIDDAVFSSFLYIHARYHLLHFYINY